MHGKILRYSATTGSGVIINASKKIFELRKESWHDNRNRPTVGMYVEFRTGENGFVVTDARASKYQEFPSDAIIREIDFWRSQTDEELRNKESEARAQIGQKIYAKTNYLKIKEIEITNSIQTCIKEFFAQELRSIEFVKDIDVSKITPIIKYVVCKRYLDKAIDYLIYTDRSISIDVFSEFQQRLATLEYSHLFFSKNELNTQKIFEDSFLEFQYSYKGAVRAVGELKDRVLQLENKIRISAQDMKALRNKIDQKSKDEDALKVKLSKIRSSTDKAHEESRTLKTGLENLDIIIKEFSNKNFKDFEELFKKTNLMLKNKIEEAMNICATMLDNKVWELGMASVSIRNVFFKHEIYEPYCMMTFLGQTAKKLDKSKIAAKNDMIMYQYYFNHQTKFVKKFLIFTSLPKVELTVKIKIMSMSKNYNTVITKKDVQFFTAINKENFEEIYIDPTRITDEELKQMIDDVKKSKDNINTKITVISKDQIQVMKE